MRQVCKYCGTEIDGVVVASASPAADPRHQQPSIPLAYEFKCNGPRQHGDDNRDRHWFAKQPDPLGDMD